MARKGRPRKLNAKRSASGRAIPDIVFDKGSEWVQARRARFDTHYNTALGRAYAGGLLAADEETALDRYQGGKRFVRAYNRVCGGETYRSALDRSPRGLETYLEFCDNPSREHDWLFAAINSMDVAGCRPYFDQLVARSYTDVGPAWLDRLLDGQKDQRDVMVLNAAIAALDILAPARKDMGIRSAQYGEAA